MKIQTGYGEAVEVTGRATAEGGAHVIVYDRDTFARHTTVTLTVPEVRALRKALKKAAGL